MVTLVAHDKEAPVADTPGGVLFSVTVTLAEPDPVELVPTTV